MFDSIYRYSASSEGAPRGTFYTANSSNQGTLPGRHIQFNTATNPWDREEKERVSIWFSVWVVFGLMCSYGKCYTYVNKQNSHVQTLVVVTNFY